MKWTKEPAFINRKAELIFLNQWISEKPQSLLFIYGPKSSGKTSLLNRFMENHVIKKDFHIKSLNLREVLLANYNDFLRLFFSVDEIDSSEKRIQSKISAGIFSIKSDIKKKMLKEQADPFVIMKKELTELNNKGKMPIIIIDELQGLEHIYINGQRELIKELFNFFVAITKESHLCHVIIASSDGFFIDRIYSDSKLSKTSEFYEVDYLTKQDVVYWLSNLKKESLIDNLVLTDKQIHRIWHYFGGSVWEINSFLSVLLHNAVNSKVQDDFLEKSAKKEIISCEHRFGNYLGKHYDYDLFAAINNLLLTSDYFYEKDLMHKFQRSKLKEELGILVQNNLFSYNPCTGQYGTQGHSVKLGLQRFCKEL